MLRTLSAICLLFSFSAHATTKTAFNIEEAKIRCQTHFSQSPEIFAQDFSWGYTLLEMADKFEEIYDSGKRLFMHSQYDPQTDQFSIFFDGKKQLPVPITESFIKNVTLQIEVAIDKGYADYVFFPDMGHSHLYFPEDHWQAQYTGENEPPKPRSNLYKKMFADPKLRPLYHLTEQLKMQNEDKTLIEDEILIFKYWHRNFVGTNDGSGNYQIEVAPPEKLYNTVSSIEGHHSYSAGFAVSASKDGCFPYTDKDGVTRYFDIGLNDPRYDPSQTGGEFGY